MRYLFDTSTWLWSAAAPQRLSSRVRIQLEKQADNDLYLSSASTWEIAIKYALGKLKLPETPDRWVPRVLREQSTLSLPITAAHSLAVSNLPFHHRDPFDRLLIAQAQLEDMTILTSDRSFSPYPVRTLW